MDINRLVCASGSDTRTDTVDYLLREMANQVTIKKKRDFTSALIELLSVWLIPALYCVDIVIEQMNLFFKFSQRKERGSFILGLNSFFDLHNRVETTLGSDVFCVVFECTRHVESILLMFVVLLSLLSRPQTHIVEVVLNFNALTFLVKEV